MNIQTFIKEIKSGRDFYVMDTETTGFSPSNADVIEISALRVSYKDGAFRVKGEYDSYINPGYPLPPAIVEFNERNKTGICDALLSTQPKARAVVSELNRFIGEKYPLIVGHNIERFDMPFIRSLYEKNGYEFLADETFDTLLCSRMYERSISSYKLCNMFELTDKKFSNEHPMFHNSLGDCYATLDVLDYLAREYGGLKHEKAKKRSEIAFEW